MSFKVDKDNIYCIVPFSRYKTSTPIDDFMENDFTIFIKAKIIKESLLKGKFSYFFARNGMHSGLHATLDGENNIQITLTYWFEFNDNKIMKQCIFNIPSNIENNFNEYIIKCDTNNSIMELFFNGEIVGVIDYDNMKKQSYLESIIWFGCGNMMSESDEHRNDGSFEYELVFALDKSIDLLEINDVINNYESNYLDTFSYNNLPVLNEHMPNNSNYKIFLNFKNYTKYKIWDMTGNGNHTQLFMKNNLYF
jgi:hypothetical protein